MTNLFGLDLSNNLSYFTIPAVFIATCLAPHSYALAASGTTYDIANPRGFLDAVAKSSLAKPLQQKIIRAKGASANGFESVGVFAAGVIAANQAGVATSTVNALSLGYLAARVAYVFVYVQLGANRRLAPLRTLVWLTGVVMCLGLWVKAGLVAMK